MSDWQLDDADIAAAQGNYAKGHISNCVSCCKSWKPRMRASICFISDRYGHSIPLGRDYAAQGDSVEADKWFQRSIDTMDAGAKTLKHPGTPNCPA